MNASRSPGSHQGALRAILAIVFAIAAWQGLATLLGIPVYLLPKPTDILHTMVAQHELLLQHLRYTVLEAGVGFVAGNLLAMGAAVWFTVSPAAEQTLLPFAIAIRSVPIVAITPIVTLVLGRGYATTVSIVVLLVFFPTLVNATRGLRSVSREAEELFGVLAASNLQRFRLLRIPWAFPYIFAAMRATAPASILGALIAEWVATDRGLGYLIIYFQGRWEISFLWGAIIIGCLLAAAGFGLVGLAERYLLAWHEATSPES